MSGSLEPGERLGFASLVKVYGSSIGVIREALMRLTEQGLVVAVPRHGFQVTSISPEDLHDLTTARAEIEILALRYAIRDGDTDWEADVVAAHHRLSSEHQYEDDAQRFTDAWAREHKRFHSALLAGCGNKRIVAAATSLRDAAELYWRWSAPQYDRDRNIACEHREIMEATIAREEDHAVELLRRHILRTTERLLVGVSTFQSADAG